MEGSLLHGPEGGPVSSGVEGKTLHHIFSVSDGTIFFRLNFNTRAMQWRLEEVSDGLAD